MNDVDVGDVVLFSSYRHHNGGYFLQGSERVSKQADDTLIKMGGRPTRPIRPTSPWTTVLVGRELWYRYAEKYEELFYDSWYSYKLGPNNSLTEADFIGGHWF